MFQNFLPNYLIGLREGLEAALVVGILVAYLVKTGNRDRLTPIWGGVGAAVAMSLAFGAALTFTAASMSFEAQEAFGGTLSIVAVGFVTWMVFWMRRAARFLKAELHGKLDAALAMGTGALVLTAFLAVGREGLETALFLWSAISSTGGSTAGPILGAALGLGTAVLLGYLLYRRAVTLNLSRFFTWTGVGLVVVAAGVLAYGVHDLQEAAILPGLHNLAFDVRAQVPASSWYGTLLKGVFNFSPAMTWLELATWTAYLVPVLYLFLRPSQPAPAPAAAVGQPEAVPVRAEATPRPGGARG
ncbi:MAG TPA: iron uptake transporter permease EfeU [Actinomycetes bacterium]|nr:iron uptake transporter permease EfeU [Actinomycetes bacterium]